MAELTVRTRVPDFSSNVATPGTTQETTPMRIPISPAAPRVTSVTDRAHAEALVAESGVTFLPDVAVTLLLNESAINGWDDVERRWRDQMGLPTDAA